MSSNLIPYEIWLHIASFLSPTEIRGLFTVNRILFNIAMDERYQKVFFGSFSASETNRNLVRLLEPDIARRVRTFTFQPGDLCKLLDETAFQQYSRMLCHVLTTLRGLSGGSTNVPGHSQVSTASLPTATVHKNFLRMVERMTLLSQFSVDIRGTEYWVDKKASLIFPPIWINLGRCLNTLELKIPYDFIRSILPTPGVTIFKHLETVHLHIIGIPRTHLEEEGSILLGRLPLFVADHRQTIKSLGFNIDILGMPNISPFLSRLPKMPQLTHFRLKQDFNKREHSDLLGLRHVLMTHGSYLNRFDIKFVGSEGYYPAPYIMFSDDCFHLPLPQLQHLTIDIRYIPMQYTLTIVPYIHQFRQSLTCLVILDSAWPFQRLQVLVDGFALGGHLMKLTLPASVFESRLLILLATGLPMLYELNVGYRKLQFYEGGPTTEEEITQFSDKLNTPSVREWRLRTLNLSALIYVSQNAMESSFNHVLKQALPGVDIYFWPWDGGTIRRYRDF